MEDRECLKIIHNVLLISYQAGYEAALRDITKRLEEREIPDSIINAVMSGLSGKLE